MDELVKERKKKQREELQNKINLVRIQAENRKKLENELDKQLGIEKSLSQFHKPVIEKMEKQEKDRKQYLEAINEKLDDISFRPIDESSMIEAIEAKKPEIYYPEKDLDVSYLKELNLPIPSDILENIETFEEMYEKAYNLKKELGSKKGNLSSVISRAKKLTKDEIEEKKKELEIINKNLSTLETYLNRLRIIKESKTMKIGSGINDILTVLDKLTDKICHGSKSKKIYNKIVVLLDMLMENGILTNDQVKQYYNKFLL